MKAGLGVCGWTSRGLSRLFNPADQRHHQPMMLDLLVEFIVELVRALLVDELSGRVRGRIRRLAAKRGASGIRRAILGVHRRNRERLLNKLLTEITEDL